MLYVVGEFFVKRTMENKDNDSLNMISYAKYEIVWVKLLRR